MIIKINDFSQIPHYKRLEIVRLYMLDNEIRGEIKETGNGRTVISCGKGFYVSCKKKKTTYIFDITE